MCSALLSSFTYKFSAFHCGCSSSVSFPSVRTCLNVDISEEQTASIFRVIKLVEVNAKRRNVLVIYDGFRNV